MSCRQTESQIKRQPPLLYPTALPKPSPAPLRNLITNEYPAKPQQTPRKMSRVCHGLMPTGATTKNRLGPSTTTSHTLPDCMFAPMWRTMFISNTSQCQH